MIEGSAVVACPIGANRYVGVWHSVPLSKDDLQGRILRRRRHQRVAEPLRLDVGQRCATSAMRARWRCSAGSAVRAVWILKITAHTVTVIFPYSRRRAKGTSRDPNRKVRTAYQSIANDVSSTTVYRSGSFRRSTIFQIIPKFNTPYGFSIRMACIEPIHITLFQLRLAPLRI